MKVVAGRAPDVACAAGVLRQYVPWCVEKKAWLLPGVVEILYSPISMAASCFFSSAVAAASICCFFLPGIGRGV